MAARRDFLEEYRGTTVVVLGSLWILEIRSIVEVEGRITNAVRGDKG